MDDDPRPDAAGESPQAGPACEGWAAWNGSSVYAGTIEGLGQRPAGKRPHGEGKTSAAEMAWSERLWADVRAARAGAGEPRAE